MSRREREVGDDCSEYPTHPTDLGLGLGSRLGLGLWVTDRITCRVMD